MPEPAAFTILSTDMWLNHPCGRLFARVWVPSVDTNRSEQKAPIVLFHDSLGCVDLWRDFPGSLSVATGRRVIAYDRHGFGRSDPRRDTLGMDFIADEAERYFPVVREQLGIHRFIALGHSVGGGMAVNCAARFSTDCEALVTIAAQFFPEDRTLQGIRVAKEQFKDEKQVERLKRYHGDKARWVLDAWIETWLHPEFAAWSLASALPQVSCPVLAIHGTHDEYGSVRHPELIGEFSGGPVQVEIIPDTYHMPHRELPKTVIELVSAFVA
ncbi:alpha/beta hydrolase [Vibrio cholerae]|uniref:alpha/beta fold hydrolase n=1 Tax=Gammaproteobacteria TaxID=1236 RepID=UPI0011D392AF|nr:MULTISPECIES: alpha/beta hydrolase [Gammaproteobacteria]MBF8950381.1 alpha/beta hydrolase [Vibrio cholerae]MBF8957633.1 alpha/beta hydrolase [Vibrio cholerae]MBF8961157.1 alpha/beta hydrolase [Vibrio cholerae]MBF8968974.1 alpha/beta hydrolase [Vibrio cholerae]MBF8974291.1 alpha/beta hydrolase [Vibrio cholerae]